MSNQSVTYLVVASCGTFVLAAYILWIVLPAWTSYTKMWERIAATFLSLYVLVGLLLVGLGGGAAIAWYWDRIAA